MFLRCKVRRKDGKRHRYWSVVENTRIAGGRVVQRHVLYLGEINDLQELAWRRSIEVLEDGAARPRTLSLFPEDRVEGLLADASIVAVKLSEWHRQLSGLPLAVAHPGEVVGSMPKPTCTRYAGYRFPCEIISHAVWLYFRFPLGLRMVEELLAARGIIVSHETVRQ